MPRILMKCPVWAWLLARGGTLASASEQVVDGSEAKGLLQLGVGAGGEQFGGGSLGERVRSLNDGGADADASGTRARHVCDGRRAWARHDIEGQRGCFSQFADDLQAREPRHEEAVRACIGVGGGAGEYVIQPRLGD